MEMIRKAIPFGLSVVVVQQRGRRSVCPKGRSGINDQGYRVSREVCGTVACVSISSGHAFPGFATSAEPLFANHQNSQRVEKGRFARSWQQDGDGPVELVEFASVIKLVLVVDGRLVGRMTICFVANSTPYQDDMALASAAIAAWLVNLGRQPRLAAGRRYAC